MKINELSQPNQLDEGLGDAIGGISRALVGDYATSSIKGMFTGNKKQLEYDLFFKDFYNDALTSLKNGIQSGIIDPSLQSAAADAGPGTDPNAPKQKNPGDSAKTGPAGGGQKPGAEPINQAYGQVVGAMRNVQPGTKPLPASMTASITKDIQNARFNKDWAINTGNKIVSLSQKGYDTTALKKAWDASTAIGRKQGTVQENMYQRLNAIFESIMKEQETGGAKSISEYMLDWFTAYMGGTNWSSYKPSIIKLVKNIEDTYSSDKGKTAIKTLAKAAYAIPGAGDAEGAKNAEATGSEKSGKEDKIRIGAGGDSSGVSSKDFETQLDALKKNNPEAFKAYMAKASGTA